MTKLQCPICGVATSLSLVAIKDDKAFLPDKSSDTHRVYGEAILFAMTDDDSPHYVSYGVLRCQACGERYVAKKHKYDDREWIPVYPIPHKPISEEIPEPIKGELEEANLCFAVGAYRGCASICQIALEALWNDKQVSGLNQLRDSGIISTALHDRATEIRLWAGIIKHKSITEPVSKEDAEQLLTYLELILDHVYVEPKRLEKLKQKRERIDKKSA